MIKFSIITVCLNAGSDLLETVESTLKQSYSEFEIIVKDGFSKDESICKLPQDKRIHLVQKKDTGIYDAMNQGIEVAQGDYMIFIMLWQSSVTVRTMVQMASPRTMNPSSEPSEASILIAPLSPSWNLPSGNIQRR